MKTYTVAVVGATGMVGRKILELLFERNFPIKELILFSGPKSAGSKIYGGGKQIPVQLLTKENICMYKYDFAFFSAGGAVSEEYAPLFVHCGATVIDNSSAFRACPDVPLIIPEVNGAFAAAHKGIISNPNCSTIQAVAALYPIHKAYGIKRIVYSTYQAVSGAGMNGYRDLQEGFHEPPFFFRYPIYGNVIPQIDAFLDNGYTKEEEKMIFETKKILDDQTIGITATAVRVPVFFGHSISINVELHNGFALQSIFDLLRAQEGIKVIQDDTAFRYPMPLDAEEKDTVFVGRIRMDNSIRHGLNLWVVADNVRKGAATNAIQIAEYLNINPLRNQ